MSFNDVRVGSFLLFNEEFPCKVTRINKSKPGKHGSAKYSLFGTDLLTNKTKNTVCSSHDKPHFIDVSRRTLYCQYFDENYACVIDDSGNEEEILITQESLLELKDKFEDGCDAELMDISYIVNDKEFNHTVVTNLKESND